MRVASYKMKLLVCVALLVAFACCVNGQEYVITLDSKGNCYSNEQGKCIRNLYKECFPCGPGNTQGCCEVTENNINNCCSFDDDEQTGTESCYDFQCVVTSQWGPWNEMCTVTCGGGTLSRERTCFCSDGVTECYDCPGLGTETTTTPCNTEPCNSVTYTWSEWAATTSCSATCGDGVVTYTRNCTSSDAASCDNIDSQSKNESCNLGECSGSGWSAWTTTGCSISCGGIGIMTYKRNCTGPAANCVGLPTKLKPCERPVCSSWGEWSYEKCVQTCGPEKVLKERVCVPIGQLCDLNNDGIPDSTKQVDEEEVDCDFLCAGWSTWENVGVCSASCFPGGNQLRTRKCNSDNDPTKCPGADEESIPCNTGICNVDGDWSDWTSWSVCSQTCDTGVRTRSRECNDPETQGDGVPCAGDGMQSEACLKELCDVNLVASSFYNWTEWSACTGSCGPGVSQRSRECVDPPNCIQNFEVETRACSDGCRLQNCPEASSTFDCNFEDFDNNCRGWTVVDSDEKAWFVHSGPTPTLKTGPSKDHTFSSGCGSYIYYEASCNVPQAMIISSNKPPHSSQHCLKFYLSMYTDSAYRNEMGSLKVHLLRGGSFSDPLAIYDGVQTLNSQHWSQKQITLDASESDYNIIFSAEVTPGFSKSDIAIDDIVVVDGLCDGPVDGLWTSWSMWSCNQTCGGGLDTRTRECANPRPLNSGKDCAGDSMETRVCENNPCPINGNWTEWEEWQDCTQSCFYEPGGSQRRVRECIGPFFGGEPCQQMDGFNETEIRDCLRDYECDVNGTWSNFTEFTECGSTPASETCGGAIFQERTRTCDGQRGNGDYCEGEERETQKCPDVPCPVDGILSEWSEFSECTPTCVEEGSNDNITRSRTRTCTPPQNNGTDCIGALTEEENCTIVYCPVNGNWGEWALEANSTCTKTCVDKDNNGDDAMGSFSRNCSNPSPLHGGEECEMNDGNGYGLSESNVQRLCASELCAGGVSAWSAWTANSSCSNCTDDQSSTRTPYQKFIRECIAVNGYTCEYESVKYLSCAYQNCQGTWSAWVLDENNTDCYASNGSFPDPKDPYDTLTNITCGGYKILTRVCSASAQGDITCKGEDGRIYTSDESNANGRNEYKFEPSFSGAACNPCPVDGMWGAWKADSCEDGTGTEVTCGFGNQKYMRACNDPAPEGSGAMCNETVEDGSKTEGECYSQHCTLAKAEMANAACSFESATCSIITPSTETDAKWTRRNTISQTQNTGLRASDIDGYYYYFDASTDPNEPHDREDYFKVTFGGFEKVQPTDPVQTPAKICFEFRYNFWTNHDITLKDGMFKLVEGGMPNDFIGITGGVEKWSTIDFTVQGWQFKTIEFDNPIWNDTSSKIELYFYAKSESIYGDRAIDSIRFYPMACDVVSDYETVP